MVIIRMSPQVSAEFECEVLIPPPGSDKNLLNLVRPCERYKELYKSCKSLKSKLYQYYVYGELLDCKHHKDNYNTCLKYRKTKDISLLDPIIEYEQNLIKVRNETVKQNKVWQMRQTPPEDFEKPLPEFLAKRQAESVLHEFEKS